MADWKDLGPGDLIAEKVVPAGPLAPLVQSSSPAENAQALRETINPKPGIFQVPPGTPTTPLPSPGQYLWENFKKNFPSIAGMTAATMVPGSGAVTGPLARTLAGGTAAGGAAALQGKDLAESSKEAVSFGTGQAGGEVVGGAVRAAANPLLRSQFAKASANQLADLIKSKVPAWQGFPSDAKGLHQMIYGKEGQARLSSEFDKALQAGIKTAREQNIRVPISAEDAEKIGLVSGGLGALEPFRGQEAKNLRALLPSAPAADVAEKIVGWWKKDPGLYRRVVGALDQAGVGDPAARAAYKWGTGAAQYLDRTKALQGEDYLPERAMAGLSNLKTVNELRRRGMGDLMTVIRGPGEKPMTAQNIGPWGRRAVGATIGEGLGWLGTGSPHSGWPAAVAGAGIGELALPRTIYHNVPMGTLSGPLAQAGPTVLGQLGREYFASSSGNE